MARRRRRRFPKVVAALAAAIVVVLIVRTVVAKPETAVPIIPVDHCVAVAGAYSGSMNPEQAGNAAIIVGESIRRGLPARAATIALVTAWQESSLRNLTYGDRDSLGLFQQRPSQGWGTADQIMDPWYSAGKFYDALVKVANWQTGNINDVAQAVQRSGFPDAYAKHETAGRAWASNLTGQTKGGLRCLSLHGSGGGADDLTALLAKVWGAKLKILREGETLHITAPDGVTAWAVGQLSLARLQAFGVASVQVGALEWVNSGRALTGWVAPATVMANTQVVVTTS